MLPLQEVGLYWPVVVGHWLPAEEVFWTNVYLDKFYIQTGACNGWESVPKRWKKLPYLQPNWQEILRILRPHRKYFQLSPTLIQSRNYFWTRFSVIQLTFIFCLLISQSIFSVGSHNKHYKNLCRTFKHLEVEEDINRKFSARIPFLLNLIENLSYKP